MSAKPVVAEPIGRRALLSAAAAIPTFALVGFIGLPLAAIFISLSLGGVRLPWDVINWATGASVPFLAACQPSPPRGCAPVAASLLRFVLTILQWAALIGVNIWLVRSGLSRRPWLNGFVLTIVFGLAAIAVVNGLSLQFDRWRL